MAKIQNYGILEKTLKMPIQKPTYNPETGKATYPFSIHHSEIKRNAKITSPHVPDETMAEQNLADDYGMNYALQSLQDRWKK